MEHYLILARSITHAQRMQRILSGAGVRTQVYRAPRELTESGCAYVLQVAARDLTAALTALRRERMGPIQIYLYQQGVYREVGG